MGSKYDTLADYLRRQSGSRHAMSFAEIEALVGTLPSSARTWRAWWANDHSHVEAKHGWLAAGWKVESVSLDQQIATFHRQAVPTALMLDANKSHPQE